MNNNEFSVEQAILFSYYIKYTKLKELVLQEFANTENAKATKVNLYIDLYDILYSIYNSKVTTPDEEALCSTIINLAAHLRGYFMRTHRVETKIYLVYGATNSTMQDKLIFGGYNRKGNETISLSPKINKVILNVFDQLDLLCKYIDQIYFIRINEFESAVAIFDLILKEEAKDNKIPNIIITKSIYAYQIPAFCSNARIFRPSKYRGTDNSYIINKENCMLQYIQDRKSNTGISEEHIKILRCLDTKLIGLLMCLGGIHTRGVRSMINILSSLRALYIMIENRILINGYNTVVDYPINVCKLNPVLVSNKLELQNRYRCIDIVSQHNIFMNSIYYNTISESIIDLISDEDFRHICFNYFIKYPIDINNL